jgi:hypothetical protein
MAEEWSEVDLVRVCGEWQRELYLLHWSVNIKFSRRERLEHREGWVHVSSPRMEADIEILDPRDRCENPTFPYDTERTIVHELLHVILDPMSGDEASTQEEQIVHTLSRTLTNLKRFK